MIFTILSLWRQRKRYLLLLCSMIIANFTVCAVCAVSNLGNALIDEELNAMGMGGLIVISASGAITESDVQTVDRIACVQDSTPLCYRYCNVTVGEQQKKILLWGVDDRVYDTVSIRLLHGRLLSDADAGSLCGMVDASFAVELFGRENIIGKTVTVPIGKLPVTFEVVGVVKTGGGLTGQLMGGTIPSFLYLSSDTLQRYTQKSGYNHLMLTIDDTDSQVAAAQVASCFSASSGVEVQNMAGSREQFSSILSVFSAVLTALGGISLFTSGISMLTVMLQNVREQTPQIGIKKALGATGWQIGAEYLMQAALLSLLGGLLGSLCSSLLLHTAGWMLGISSGQTILSGLLPAVPGMLCTVLFGVYPAIRAANCIPAEAIAKL